MPELPEVETVKTSLNTLVSGKTIREVRVYYSPMVEGSIWDFQNALKGKTVQSVSRRGKYLLWHLGDTTLVSHLRMEGKYYLKDVDAQKDKHEHVVFVFDDGESLHYHDVRKFGTFVLRETETLFATPPLDKLGPEPLSEAFTPDALRPYLKGERSIKTVLLDQRTVAGIGNIYADEILYCAGVHPKTKAKSVRDADTLVRCVCDILIKAVRDGGASIRSYKNTLGESGRFQLNLNVHTREGEPCRACSHTIVKTKVGNRGTYYCPHCQKR